MKVLFVDNEDDIVSLVEIALEIEDDIELTTANSGEAGLELISFQAFDVLIFDLMMPKPDGRDMLAHARSSSANGGRPIIICTAKSEQSATEDLLRAGATKVISKPFDPLSLGCVIRSVAAGGA